MRRAWAAASTAMGRSVCLKRCACGATRRGEFRGARRRSSMNRVSACAGIERREIFTRVAAVGIALLAIVGLGFAIAVAVRTITARRRLRS